MPLTTAINRNSKILAIFAVACTAIVGIVNFLTKDRIYIQHQKQLLSTLNNLIEPSRYTNEITLDCVTFAHDALGVTDQQTAYIARLDDKPIAMAMTTTAPDGYSGNIDLLVAINMDGSLSGVRVLEHQETPGLGDKVEIKKSSWIETFKGKQLNDENAHRWAVVKDGGMFDQFTGATITPRAVVKAVKKSVLFFNEHKAHLLSLPNACQPSQETLETNREQPVENAVQGAVNEEIKNGVEDKTNEKIEDKSL